MQKLTKTIKTSHFNCLFNLKLLEGTACIVRPSVFRPSIPRNRPYSDQGIDIYTFPDQGIRIRLPRPVVAMAMEMAMAMLTTMLAAYGDGDGHDHGSGDGHDHGSGDGHDHDNAYVWFSDLK